MVQFYSEKYEKAHLLNNFFVDQTYLDESNVILPDVPSYDISSSLDTITLLPLEVKIFLTHM